MKINQSTANIQNKLQEFKKKSCGRPVFWVKGRFLRYIGMWKSEFRIRSGESIVFHFGGENDAPWETTHFSACSYIYGPKSIEKV